ncbi:MAG: GGDEF domain-containing protein [Desulfobacula sp.]|nr:GGDEF domain-containing protein [Desulfobacula sp.]
MKQKWNNLILIVSLLLITGFLTTSLASYYVSLASLRSQITKKELPLTSDNIYSEIQKDLLSPIFISSLMANDIFLRDWIINGENDITQIIRYLKEIQDKYNTFTSFFVSEQTKTYYHADGILKKVKAEEERDRWYFRVKSMKSDYEINVDPDMANKDSMTIFINYRVRDYQNNFIGTTGVGLKVNAVKDLIKKYQESYGRNIYFVDKKGMITLHGSSLLTYVKQLSEIEGVSSLASDILSKPDGYFRYKRNGKTIHLNTRYIPEFEWYLLVEQSEENGTRQIFKALQINLAVCAVITLVVLSITNMTISAYQKRLEKIAMTDKLTGIYNRHAFDFVMSPILKDVRRKKFALSLILFDIDHFKKVNDEFGHLAGDAAIKKIVRICAETIRESDVLCRWGGEEFLILLKECDLDDAYEISEKIRKTIQDTPIVYEGKTIFSTISLGVSQYHLPETEDRLIYRADKLLYQAKQNGRNRSEIEPF